MASKVPTQTEMRVESAQFDLCLDGLIAERNGVRVLLIRQCPALTDVIARLSEVLGGPADLWVSTAQA